MQLLCTVIYQISLYICMSILFPAAQLPVRPAAVAVRSPRTGRPRPVAQQARWRAAGRTGAADEPDAAGGGVQRAENTGPARPCCLLRALPGAVAGVFCWLLDYKFFFPKSKQLYILKIAYCMRFQVRCPSYLLAMMLSAMMLTFLMPLFFNIDNTSFLLYSSGDQGHWPRHAGVR